MEKIALCVCTIFFIIGYISEPKKLNPITIFFGEWTIILFLTGLKLYSIIPASDYIYQYILVGCISFGIGFYVTKFKKVEIITPSKKINVNEKKIVELNKPILYTLIGITILFLIIDSATSVIALIQGNTLQVIRKYSQEGMQYSSNRFINAFRILIITPMSFVVMPLAAMEFFKQKKDKYIIVSAIIISILKVIGDGGRSPIVFLGMCFIICYFYQTEGRIKRKKIQISKFIIKKKSIYFWGIMIIGALFLYRVTLSRSGADTVRYTYYYFAMEPIMFEKWAVRTDQTGLIGYGMASFNGFLFPLFYLISSVFQVGYPEGWRQIYDLIESVGTDWQAITSMGLTANSYASAFWNLYLDGRVWGIIFGMFLYGVFVSNIYKKVINIQNEKYLSVFCLVMLGVFYSFQFMIFENIYYALAYIVLNFIVYKKKGRSDEKLE